MATVRALDEAAPLVIMAALLEESAGVTQASALVSVGDTVAVDDEDGYLRGRGTMMQAEPGEEERLVATVCGSIQRVNKLVMVQPFSGRYAAQLGDIIVGRVAEVQTRRWAVDMGAMTQASLQLSAVDLPGGIQRRRTTDDELSMRQVYREGDVIAAEVQQLNKADQSVALHMRGSKYRKLRHGQVVTVPASAIRRRSSHFIHIAEKGVQLIIGCNGWLWIGALDPAAAAARKPGALKRFGAAANEESEDAAAAFMPTAEQWGMVARFSAAARALSRLTLPVHRDALEAVVDRGIEMGVTCVRMLDMEFLTVIIGLEEARREAGGEVKGGDDGDGMQVD